MILSREGTTPIESMDDWILEGYWNSANTFEISKVIHSQHKKKLAQLYYEFELANQLDVPTIIKPHTIEQEEQFLKITYNSKTPYISLAEYISVPLSTYNFLKISIKITNCFIDLHQASYIYRNLHPKHFLIDTQTLDVKLFNLEYSYPYTNFKHLPETENTLPRHRLAYLSPEETGRVNSLIDFRSDLYSLGVLFYEMITGRTPYDEQQANFFNKMLTTDPPTFKELGIKAPPVIEKIIRKLLSKNKNNRYQSAIGLKEDLTHCLHLFTNDLPLQDFELGLKEHLGENRLTTTIPTRERLLNTLLQNLKAGSNSPQVHLITGDLSSGKSFFLAMLHNALQINERYLLMLHKNSAHIQTKVPIFILAIRQQLENIQKKGGKLKRLWEKQLHQLNLMVPQSTFSYLPELELYKEYITVVDDLQHIKQEQFFSLLAQLIATFHQPNLPATILVDDWEDLDEDSLQFIRFLMRQNKNYLFIITSNLSALLEHRPFPSNCTVFEHSLRYLTEADILEWVQQSFQSNEPALMELGQFLYETTKGSPLLIKEIFWQVCEQKLLKFNHYEHKWLFDISSSPFVGKMPAFRAFIERQMNDLPPEQRLVLQYASCIGKSFQFDILYHVVPLKPEEILHAYISLIEAHFFIAKQEDVMLLRTFVSLDIVADISFESRFLYDDVFEVTTAITTNDEKSAIHYGIYQYLTKNMAVANRNRLMIHHLSFCKEKMNKEEKIMYLQLNYQLGCDTIITGMYSESLLFSQEAFTILTSSKLDIDYKLALEVYVLYANSLYLTGRDAEANEIFELSLQQCQTLYDRLFVYNEKIMFHMMERADSSTYEELLELLALADQALRPLNIPLKADLNKGQVLKEYILLKMNSKNFSSKHFLELPEIESEEIKLILKMLMNILGVALLINEKLYAWIVMRAIRLMIKHGDLSTASVFYGNYANILMTGFKDFDASYRFALLSLKHHEKHNSEICKGNVYLNYGLGISSFKKSYDTSIYYLKQLQKSPIDDSLQRLYNATASAYILSFMHFQGVNLQTIKNEHSDYENAINSTQNEAPKAYVKEFIYWIDVLQNPREKINWQLPIPIETRASFKENHLILRLQMSYLLFETQQAEVLLKEIQEIYANLIFSGNQPHYYFYKALWLFRKLEEFHSKKDKAATWKQIKHCLKQLNIYASHNPHSFEHYSLLIQALYYQHKNQPNKAIFRFDRAIQLAKLLNNTRDEAIAKLNSALFYEAQQDFSKAQLYMQSAIQSLYAWKAPRIVELWAERFSHLWKKNLLVTEAVETSGMDVQQIIAMYQTIAKESELSSLIEKGLFEIMRHLDAEQIYFFNVSMQAPRLLAYANTINNRYDHYETQVPEVPATILQDVQRVIASETFSLNSNSAQLGSVLSLPLFVNGALEAVIYCTNDLVTSLFTKQKIDVVTILATQLLLAMENIERQRALEQQVSTRTLELSQANEQLKHMNSRLQQNDDELKRFIQHISHDLRTPITSVLGYVEALSGNLVQDEEKKQLYLERSKIRLLALNRLIQDLFDISQLEGGRIKFNKEEISAKQFFTMIDTVIQNDLEQLAVHYIRSYKGEDAVIQVDVNRFMQVISNMTNNISKYANEGTVQLTMTCDGNTVEIILQDEGRGIPAKDLPFIFDLNFKASNNRNNQESYGIGLAICKQIVGHHNGLLQVASEENKGTAFTITLPCVPLEDEIM